MDKGQREGGGRGGWAKQTNKTTFQARKALQDSAIKDSPPSKQANIRHWGSCEKLHKKLRFADPVFITPGINKGDK